MACLPDASCQRAHPCAVWHLRASADQTPISGPGSAASAGLIGGIAVAVTHPLRPRAKHASTRKRAGRFPGPRPCCAQKATTAQGGEDAEKESSLAFLTDEKQLDAQIWTLALPAFIALCAEPLLSIIDTAFVGRLPDAALSLGGLGAATSVFDFVFRCYNFLCVVLVPLVAEAVIAKKRGEATEDPADIVGRVIGLAAALGFLTWALIAFGSQNVLELAGVSAGTSLGTVADGYLRIRATALPASLVNTVAVGAFRGHLDTSTPLLVVLVQTLSDVALDAVFVYGVAPLGIPAMGVDGAAWATALSIWIACICFAVLLSQRGYVAWKSALSWPTALQELQPLIIGSLSQLIRTLSLQAVLLEFTRTVVGLDATGLIAAAHQVGLRVWYFALFALDCIAVSAQGLVPVALATAGVAKARWVSSRLLLWGGVGGTLSGLLIASLASSIPALFTNDEVVAATATPLILTVAALQPIAGVVFTWDGLFQGLSDYAYLALAMAVAALATLGLLQLDFFSGSLQGVWEPRGGKYDAGEVSKRQQLELAKQRVAEAGVDDKVSVIFCDYRDVVARFGAEYFSKAVSVEMIEAVGHEYLPVYFRALDQCLKPGGMVAIQAICVPDERYESYRKGSDFIREKIFPGSHLPCLAEIHRSCSQLSLRECAAPFSLGLSYAATLKEWRRRFTVNESQIRQLVSSRSGEGFDDHFVRRWNYYFAYCETGFRLKHIDVWQLCFLKDVSLAER
ncbi:ufaA1, partial [Symbiodinium necroappetens]